ncbi:MAG: DUF1127 domain-containing protein [Proteobacteria bacterium]|nr:DUF1127 domain-containing protein [Pseudomonadota bacterium]
METPFSYQAANRPRPARHGFRPGWLARLVHLCLDWQERMQQRRRLSGLSAHMLKDIGLTGVDVEMEIRKLPWQG